MSIIIPSPADPNPVQWCSVCEVHLATSTKPLCPVCLDIETRERRWTA